MMHMAIAPVLALSFLLQTSATPNLSGKWSVHREVEGRQGDSVCTFEQHDKALTGECVLGKAKVPVTGTVEGGRATWKHAINIEGATSLVYSAPVAADTLAGNLDVEPLGVTGTFTATRIKD